MKIHRLGLEAFRDLAGHIGGIEPDEPTSVLGKDCALVFRKPRVGLAIGLFIGPDPAAIHVPAARIHDTGKKGSGLDQGQFRGILIFPLHGPLKKSEEKEAPEQTEQERKTQHMPAESNHLFSLTGERRMALIVLRLF